MSSSAITKQIGYCKQMHLKFQLNPLNGSGVVAIINFEFNQISCLVADWQKLNK